MGNKAILNLLLFTLFLGACASLPPADPKLSATLNEEALRATARQDYATAVAKFEEAIHYNPRNGQLYRQKAEILETLQAFAEAGKVYQLALSRLPREDVGRELIYYRLGLIQARSNQQKAAQKSLEKVTEPWMKLDLEGMIKAHGKNPESALELFQQALSKTSEHDQQARIYYHASLTHHKLGNVIESKNMLFYAVNNASSLALKQHIRLLFSQIR